MLVWAKVHPDSLEIPVSLIHFHMCASFLKNRKNKLLDTELESHLCGTHLCPNRSTLERFPENHRSMSFPNLFSKQGLEFGVLICILACSSFGSLRGMDYWVRQVIIAWIAAVLMEKLSMCVFLLQPHWKGMWGISPLPLQRPVCLEGLLSQLRGI